MGLSLALFLSSLLLSAPLAIAASGDDDDPFDWYFEFATGASFVPNQSLRNGTTSMSRAEQEVGFLVGGALGTEMLDFVRIELRVDYRESDVEKAALVSPATTADGEISLLSVMVNGYYDLDLDDFGIAVDGDLPVIPFIGAGIGYGLVAFDFQRDTRALFDVDDKDHVFVYNAMVGARVPISKVSEVSLAYRYVGTVGADNIGTVIAGLQQDIRAEYDAHELVLGLRFNF